MRHNCEYSSQLSCNNSCGGQSWYPFADSLRSAGSQWRRFVALYLHIRLFFVSDRAEGMSEHNSAYWDLPPYFDNSSKREYITTVGQTAHLHCRVRNLGDRAVSSSLLLIENVSILQYFIDATEVIKSFNLMY